MARLRLAKARYRPSIWLALGVTSSSLLTACGSSQSDPGPGGVSIEDARQLDEAAKKLDSRTAPMPKPATPNKKISDKAS
jgi:hypothetical protein